MDSYKLKYVITIAEEQSISKAAKRLYVSQPALTKHINNLEKELGIKLFDRTATPIHLTYAGELFLSRARQILAVEHQMQLEFEEIAAMRRGRLNIGIGSSRGYFWLPHLLPPFMKQYPGIDVKICEGTNSYFEESLSKGTLDIAFYALPIESADLDYEEICDERILLFASPEEEILEGLDISKASFKNPLYVDPHRLSGARFFRLPPGSGLYRTTEQIMARHGIKPGSVMELTNSDTAYALAAEGLGVTFSPESCYFYPNYPKKPICCTVESPPFSRKIVAVYRKDTPLSPVKRNFIDLTKDIVLKENLV